eukprot:6585104-Heterocapsa_arctica.AAC.1
MDTKSSSKQKSADVVVRNFMISKQAKNIWDCAAFGSCYSHGRLLGIYRLLETTKLHLEYAIYRDLAADFKAGRLIELHIRT